MNIKKRCNHTGCRKLIDVTDSYCEVHRGSVNRDYSRLRRRDDKEYIQFYSLKVWRDCRYQVLLRDEFLCQHCLEEGRFVEATLVHHIRERKDAPELELEMTNLVSLCEASHNWVHSGVKNKWLM